MKINLNGYTPQQILGFTDADLALNQNGRLSPDQQARLMWRLRREVMVSWVQWSALPIFVGLMVVYFLIIPPLGDRLGPLICPVIALALFLGVTLVRLLQSGLRWLILRALNNPVAESRLRRHLPAYDRSVRFIEQGVVEAVTGRLTLESDGEHEQLLFNGEPLDDILSNESLEMWSLETNRNYTLYRVVGGLWIVSFVAHDG